MRSPSVLPYAKYGAIFASSYLACYTPDAKRLKQYSIDQLSFLQSAGPESARKRLAVSSI